MSHVIIERLVFGAAAVWFAAYGWSARRSGKIKVGPRTFDRAANPQGFRIGMILNWILVGFAVLWVLIAN